MTTNLKGKVPQLHIVRCPWGDAHGARLNAGGLSLPAEARPFPSAATEPVASEAEEAEAVEVSEWAALEADPYAELRILGQEARSHGYSPVAQSAVARSYAEVSALDSALFAEFLSEHGLEPVDLDEAKRVALDGLGLLPEEAAVDLGDLRRAMGRLMAVSVVDHADARWGVGGAAVDGDSLDALVAEILTSWGAPKGELGIVSSLTKPLWLPLARGFEYTASSVLRGNRLKQTEHGTPMIGDILRYQVRGEGVRAAVAEAIDSVDGPVVVLAHSLGGVACVDLLASQNRSGKVTALVTVGSQAPFFYELDALWSLPFGTPLPPTFPAWWNVFDPRDPLAYVGEQVFGSDRVTDVEFDTRRPLLRAHSAYWGHQRFYTWLAGTVLS
ncbi:hypothetical protein [Streptacidiphilus sp. P02-A3a]|uniref:hypothetical protein n=1 Tax=Streptacidiphilus sp. P02-A3a TaxID=2704468 RepID=UPI0015FCDDB0|nr:hypothetical protein [Streptacidiphilus sp. P02-A3a]QMU72442.1 hypothetical protein GXP74_33555 [Streptacidiphilus sp. P02-A3a]